MPGNTKFTPYKKPEKKLDVKSQMLVIELKNPEGNTLGPPLNIPSNVTPQQLQLLVHELLSKTDTDEIKDGNFSFFVENNEITKTIEEDVIQAMRYSPERIITIVYQPQSFFKVKPVTRCSSTLTGHQQGNSCFCICN
jgi:ribosome assembly protein 4